MIEEKSEEIPFNDDVEAKILDIYPSRNNSEDTEDNQLSTEMEKEFSKNVYGLLREFHKKLLEHPNEYLSILFPEEPQEITTNYFFKTIDNGPLEIIEDVMNLAEEFLKRKYEVNDIFMVRDDIKKKFAFEVWKESLHLLTKETYDIPMECYREYKDFASRNGVENIDKFLETHFGRLRPINGNKVRKMTTKEFILKAVDELSGEPKNFKKILRKVREFNPKVDNRYLSVMLSQMYNDGLIDKEGTRHNYRYFVNKREKSLNELVFDVIKSHEKPIDFSTIYEEVKDKKVDLGKGSLGGVINYLWKKGLIERTGKRKHYKYSSK
ncbi:MAG: hypothetical protein J7K87_03120 [Candidatus Aenigmarchaeota archaeon]|nr:hypothetical protein [Candidatus Aenigmarchaeota archaeon]